MEKHKYLITYLIKIQKEDSFVIICEIVNDLIEFISKNPYAIMLNQIQIPFTALREKIQEEVNLNSKNAQFPSEYSGSIINESILLKLLVNELQNNK